MKSTLKLIKYSVIAAVSIFAVLVIYGVSLKFNLVESEPPTPNELKFRRCLHAAHSFDNAEQCIAIYSKEIDTEESVTVEKAISNAEQEVVKIEQSIDNVDKRTVTEPITQSAQ